MNLPTRTLFVCLLLLLSGCSALDPGGSGPRTVEAGLTPLPETQQDGFNYEGYVELSGVGESCLTNVTVAMYSSDKTHLGSVEVGTLCYTNEAPQKKPITLTAETTPAYIIIESPDFWDDDADARPVGHVRDPELGYYRPYPIERRNQIQPDGDIAEPDPTNATGAETRQTFVSTDSIPLSTRHLGNLDEGNFGHESTSNSRERGVAQ